MPLLYLLQTESLRINGVSCGNGLEKGGSAVVKWCSCSKLDLLQFGILTDLLQAISVKVVLVFEHHSCFSWAFLF